MLNFTRDFLRWQILLDLADVMRKSLYNYKFIFSNTRNSKNYFSTLKCNVNVLKCIEIIERFRTSVNLTEDAYNCNQILGQVADQNCKDKFLMKKVKFFKVRIICHMTDMSTIAVYLRKSGSELLLRPDADYCRCSSVHVGTNHWRYPVKRIVWLQMITPRTHLLFTW